MILQKHIFQLALLGAFLIWLAVKSSQLKTMTAPRKVDN